MDGMVETGIEVDIAALGMAAPAQSEEDGPAAGEGATPFLTLEGFSGPLDHLLTLARAQRIDLTAIPLSALLDQLAAALQQAPASVPLGQKGDWVVMAAWLVQLRTRLLLPADPAAQQDAVAEAGQLRDRLIALQEVQALAGWLERSPQLGRDVFARGRPEVFGVSAGTAEVVDVVEFLWASLALFDDHPMADTVDVYRPVSRPLHSVVAARERILRSLAESPDGGPLDRFLPELSDAGGAEALSGLRRRSAWSSTFVAGLELARQGEVALSQHEPWSAIQICTAGQGAR
jgi:segregation and condensation protein A